MFAALKSLFGGSEPGATSGALTPVDVANSVYVVGDIHGAASVLEALLERIDEDLASHDMGQPFLVFVGDYVDRGDHSAQVLEMVMMLERQMPGQVICLRGNHEAMMLGFLQEPAEQGRRWLRNGGLQTLASFGVGGVTERSEGPALEAAAQALRTAMPTGVEGWLSGLRRHWQSGNLICVHAALDPLLPPEAQSDDVCLWGHSGFLKAQGREDGLWVAHGHTIVEEAGAENGRISIDTGAYVTGVLTAVALAPGQPLRFIQTR